MTTKRRGIIIIIHYIYIALFWNSKTLYSMREGRQTGTGKTDKNRRGLYTRANGTQVATIKGGADNHMGRKTHKRRRALKREGKVRTKIKQEVQ